MSESREKLIRERELRSKRWGIRVRPDGHLTKPKEWEHLSDNQFADPVNYMYPVHDATHCRAALVYFIRFKNAYDPRSRLVLLTRILQACIRHGVEVSWETVKKNFPEIADKVPDSIKKKLVGYEEAEKKAKKETLDYFGVVYDFLVRNKGLSEHEAVKRAVRAVKYLES